MFSQKSGKQHMIRVLLSGVSFFRLQNFIFADFLEEMVGQGGLGKFCCRT